VWKIKLKILAFSFLKLTNTQEQQQSKHASSVTFSWHFPTCFTYKQVQQVFKKVRAVFMYSCGNFLYTLLFKMLHIIYTEPSLVMLLENCSIQWCLCSHNVNMSTPFLDYTIWFSWSEWVEFSKTCRRMLSQCWENSCVKGDVP